MNSLSLHLCLLAIGVTTAWAGLALAVPPQWARQNTQSLSPDGKIYTVVCSATSVSLSQARQEAMTDCDLQASRQLKSTTYVKSLSVETENQVGYHGEVASELKVQNLNCRPQKEDADYNSGTVTVFLKCKYDLSGEGKDASAVAATKAIQNEDATSTALSTVPKCDSVIIRGIRPRTVECKTNPVNITIYPSDTEIIVRLKGYQPETLKPSELTGGKSVYLKPL